MGRITVWGDFKANSADKVNLSGELQLLLNQSDINIVNFEAPVNSAGKAIKKSGPNLSQNEESIRWLENRGFNLISLANNHMMDYGNSGLEATLGSFKLAETMGAGAWDSAYRIVVKEQDGIKIGFLAGTHGEFGILEEKRNKDQKGCAWCGHPDFETLILNSKKVCDYLIVINHGGLEYVDYPLPEWKKIYKKWIDLGADAVIASHPHVPQGWELYKKKPIFYSLGNFCFQSDNVNHQHWYDSLCCILDIDAGEVTASVKYIRYDYQRQYIHENHEKNFEAHMQTINAVLSDEKKYMSSINKAVIELLTHYWGLYARSGFLYPVKSLGFLKGIVERFKKEHMYNCLKCESHRWAIIRAMKLKYKVDIQN